MIDLHTHSIFSDGELIPAELLRRANVKGYKGIAITDHMDISNMEFIIPRIVTFAEEMNKRQRIKVIPGAEITHVLPDLIPDNIKIARKLGAKIVVIHGETLVEPVAKGTNRAAIEGGADILAHPGLISEEDVKLAVEKGVALEISARAGHCFANGHVAKLAIKYGAKLLINTDAHSPKDLIDKDFAEQILLAAGLDKEAVKKVFIYAEHFLEKV